MLIILLGCLLALLTAVSYFEKRMAWPYGHLEPQPQFNAISGYSSRWVEEARQAGFSFLGWAPDTKGPRYRVSYAMMVSPERDCFVIIGAGTLGNISVQGTWMYSPGTADRMFSSTDNQMCVEIDVLRCWRGQTGFSQHLCRSSACPQGDASSPKCNALSLQSGAVRLRILKNYEKSTFRQCVAQVGSK